ncbi:MAG: 5-(carboxyamino)imidazole ribonucleotide synthase [Firmicutes bacterium]|nr:5-(carboxyamino)imidazole ribonucleotide synthase [Bacillota bacterium]
MMLLEAKKMGFYAVVLDPTEDCPAHSICDEHIVADFDDEEAFNLIAAKTDVLTYEFEHINADALLKLEEKGFKVYPTAKSLKIIQDKLTQKNVLSQNNIPCPDYMPINGIEDIKSAGKIYGYPYMLKARTGGYDGKGNSLVKNEAAAYDSYKELGEGEIPLMAEKLVNFKMETSVLACRSLNGDIAVYPVGDNEHKDSILFKTKVPAEISPSATKKAMDIAANVLKVFEGIGMFCVELFVTENDDIFVNEIAPRPHNSGHYTIEGCVTSQFENHIRAIVGLPLGSTKLVSPTVMVNLLGEGITGKTQVSGLYEALSQEGVSVHIYGKGVSKNKRKMGHITAVAEDLKTAEENALKAYNNINITGKGE